MMRQDLSRQLEQMLSSLSPREREVLPLRFGIGDEGAHTLDDVGARFDLTRERIWRIETMALRKLRLAPRGRALGASTEN
jgi:RNA polymerase primary sigma factor